MPSIESTLAFNNDLVRKGLNGGVILGRYPTVPILTTLHAADGLIDLPSGYETVGQISEDGLTFGMDDEVAEVRGWGSSTFVRRDITSSEKTFSFAALETRKLTKELTANLDLSGVTMSAEGEVVVTHPDRPATRYWRALCLATDGDGASRYYFGKFYSRAAVTEREEEAWNDGDDTIAYGVTMSGMLDNTAGFALREFMFGPGALAAAAAMGWTLGTLTAPANLAVGTEAATTVPLTWDAVAGADTYQVRILAPGDDQFRDVSTAQGGTPATNSTTITGLTASTHYLFKVLAVDAGGNRGPVSTVSVPADTTA